MISSTRGGGAAGSRCIRFAKRAVPRRVNDSISRPVGRCALSRSAERLSQLVRNYGMVATLGVGSSGVRLENGAVSPGGPGCVHVGRGVGPT